MKVWNMTVLQNQIQNELRSKICSLEKIQSI